MKNLRWDLIALPIVALILGFVIIELTDPITKVPVYIFWSVAAAFTIYWIVTGEIKRK